MCFQEKEYDIGAKMRQGQGGKKDMSLLRGA